MYDCEYYKYISRLDGTDCYDDFYELVFDFFGLSRSTASRLMDINRKFCDGTMYLLDRYMDYSYSQLSEMLAIKRDDDLRMVRPDMSVRQIRDFKQRIKDRGNLPVLCDVAQRCALLNPNWFLSRFLRCI